MNAFLDNPVAMFAVGVGFFVLLMFWGDGWGNKKRRLTIAAWANPKVIRRARRIGLNQLKKPSPKRVCLYIGNPPELNPSFFSSFFGRKLPLLVPSCNPLIEVVGKSGSGKTYSVINPLLLSAIDQGLPILLYDVKADSRGLDGQMSFLATYAKSKGYDVNIFAPGRDYSCTINPLDFMSDHNDKAMASTIAKVFQENLRGGDGGGKKDGFFGPAGERLVTALIQFAKYTETLGSKDTADLAMAFQFLCLPDLPKRLKRAKEDNNPNFPEWVRVPFEQLMAVADAAPTSGGILGQATDLLEEFIESNLMRSYIGKTNVNLKLGSKQMLIFQSDTQRQVVVNPLLAAVITILIDYNFAEKREDPLICCFDEFPTIILNKLPDWANRLRSKGLVLILGYQEFNQLEKGYGRENANIIRSPANHRFWFNPGTENTAKGLSDYLGQTEVILKNNSRSRNFGTSGGSKSISEQITQIPLMSADEINSMVQGECIYIGAEYVEKLRDPRDKKLKERIRPYHLPKIPLASNYEDLEKKCEKFYKEKVYPWLINRVKQVEWDLIEEIQKRRNLAESLLPYSSGEDKGNNLVDFNF
ncbi:type IV secretory system conjugative DNA transfer family protein [Gloeothece verrucosa]|uniref:TRAG family protein n=1 Tax=Gloeothece verrucosa (strain PCC 7822) TaxID=497965 RepID=E0UM98_GLOV7|nr:TraM recognition domain-containing protein [Gloeothece verrucosa]ADN18078.1 TRAG family protein [Gloeothece verrucosa PCC 7822]